MPEYDKEAAAERQKARTKELTDRLEAGMKELYSSDKYKDYLKSMSNFYQYSSRNIMLIHQQMPNATRIASYRLWGEKFNRHVKKNETGLYIYAPMAAKEHGTKTTEKLDPETGAPLLDENGRAIMEEMTALPNAPRFKLVPVFDVSQTYGDPLPELVENISGDVAQYAAFVDALKAVSPLPIEFEPLPENKDGYCEYGVKIGIRENMGETQTVCAVIHEMAHDRLHDKNKLSENTEPKKQRAKEIEAESIAYVVCQHYGIETSPNSFGYLAEYGSRDMSELKASLDTVRKEANGLITAIDEKFDAICKERGIDLAEITFDRNGNKTMSDTFAIYQLKDIAETRGLRFEGLADLEKRGIAVDRSNYHLAYTAPLPPGETLEGIYRRFNAELPKDFTGHSLSVSDVVVIQRDGETTSHYIDRFGFAELPAFPGAEKQRARAAATEQPETDYKKIPPLTIPEPPPPEISKKDAPIYRYPAEYALQSGEIEDFRRSREVNVECGQAIDRAISESNYELYRYDLKTAAKTVIAEFGVDRVAWVLAGNINASFDDGRFSNPNKSWAKEFDTPKPDIHLKTHRYVLDGFADRFREAAKEKPSLLDTLGRNEQKSKNQFSQTPDINNILQSALSKKG